MFSGGATTNSIGTVLKIVDGDVRTILTSPLILVINIHLKLMFRVTFTKVK